MNGDQVVVSKSAGDAKFSIVAFPGRLTAHYSEPQVQHTVRRLLAAAPLMLTLLFVSAPASSQDRAQAEARVSTFNATLQSGNWAATINFLPPRIVEHLSTRFGVSEAELRRQLSEVISTAMSSVTLESSSMDMSAAAIATTPDGARAYLLVPTQTQMVTADGARRVARTQTLVVEDGGEWYLVRIDSHAQVATLRSVYPEFNGVEFATGTVSIID